MSKRAIFVGRWSPFHKGHLAIMKKKIEEGKPLLIFIRDTHYDIYSPMLRKRMIEATMAKMKVDAKVIIIDDIESINYGRGVGYEINEIEVHENIKRISATEIRAMIERGEDTWREIMPEGADKVLEDYLSKGLVVWFTGLPKSGKSTIAKLLASKLEDKGVNSEQLNGSKLRSTISKELSFSKKDRDTNLERAVYLSKLLTKNGAVVLSSFITPYQDERDRIRKELEEHGSFIQVHVKSSVENCKLRDKDGLYEKAEKGEIEAFTGVSDPYEEPNNADIVLDTDNKSMEECAEELNKFLETVL